MLTVLGALLVVLVGFGLAQQVFMENLAIPIIDGINRLSPIFAVVICIDLLATAVLGTIEAIIERLTGSATFQNGKLVAVSREEIIRQREADRAKQERQRQAAKTRAPAGPPSVYALPLPIPGAPGREAAEPVIVSREPATVLPSGAAPARRVEPSVIAGTAVVKTDDELAADAPASGSAHRPAHAHHPAAVEEDEDADNEAEEADLLDDYEVDDEDAEEDEADDPDDDERL
ncbi:MAG: hypothetical protein U0521_07295 [Anaerolineae bacterium]